MDEAEITLSISFRGSQHTLSLPGSLTLQELAHEVDTLTSVPAHLQKLLHKGKKLAQDETSLEDAGLKDGVKIQLLGPLPSELDDMQKVEAEKRRREDILRAREAKASKSKPRSTGKATINNYNFHSVAPLPHLPSPHLAEAVLKKLAADPAILHVMSLHQFSIGLLTELAPHEHPNLLGLNVNKGQVIKLRVRTDAYDGIRNYREIRRVLCHELTHCVWGDHDNDFKELNSILNREVADYEASVKAGTHSLSGHQGAVYEPSVETQAETSARVLGGGPSSIDVLVDNAEARRARVLRAALDRLSREDQEIEDMCGNAPHSGQDQHA